MKNHIKQIAPPPPSPPRSPPAFVVRTEASPYVTLLPCRKLKYYSLRLVEMIGPSPQPTLSLSPPHMSCTDGLSSSLSRGERGGDSLRWSATTHTQTHIHPRTHACTHAQEIQQGGTCPSRLTVPPSRSPRTRDMGGGKVGMRGHGATLTTESDHARVACAVRCVLGVCVCVCTPFSARRTRTNAKKKSSQES